MKLYLGLINSSIDNILTFCFIYRLKNNLQSLKLLNPKFFKPFKNYFVKLWKFEHPSAQLCIKGLSDL